jgi:hypothetical protein
LRDEILELLRGQHILFSKPLEGRANLADGIEGEPLVTNSMGIKNGERALYFGLRRRSEIQAIEPTFDLNSPD